MQDVIKNFVIILILIIIIIIILEEVNGIVNNGNILWDGKKWRCYNEGNRKICYQQNEF